MKDLKKGSVVLMAAKSKLQGWGNPQCVESVCEPLGEISLYGHNQHYKIHHICKIIESPENPLISKIEELIIVFNTWLIGYNETEQEEKYLGVLRCKAAAQELIDEVKNG